MCMCRSTARPTSGSAPAAASTSRVGSVPSGAPARVGERPSRTARHTAWYGGGMRICPAADPADPADGAFDVTVVGPVSRRELVRTRPRLTAGTHVEPPAVTVHRARRVEPAGEGLRTHADGEPVAPLPAASVCVPGALSVVGTGR
jgi:diacylglycerol kinase family enzyme